LLFQHAASDAGAACRKLVVLTQIFHHGEIMIRSLTMHLGWKSMLTFLFVFIIGKWAFADSADDWARMQGIRPKGYVCYRAESPPEINGRLDDAAWQSAPWTDDFGDIEGDRKPKPRFRTRAKMLWDAKYFYLAVEMEEPHVWGTLTKHDSVIFHDNDFEFFIDPDGDNHEYYEFEINALNTTWDLFLPRPYKDGGKAEDRWEIPGLITAVHVDGTLNNPADQDKSWSVEIAVPWGALREFAHRPSPPRDGDQWRVNFSRVEWQHEGKDGKYKKIPNLPENNWVWSPQGIIDMHRPERWGYVQFSTSPAGSVQFTPDPTATARDALLAIYHHQKAFHLKHQKWAQTLDQLGLDQAILKGAAKTPVLKTTPNGFRASIEVKLRGDVTEVWSIRQDSRLRRASADDETQDAIEGILSQQVEAWNSGDIDEFMRHYWRSDELTFSSGGRTTRGWETTKDGYKRRYPTREKMGTLSFGAIAIQLLGDASALVLGRWDLQRESAPVGGNFSLICRRIDGAWVIVHDHTSVEKPVEPQLPMPVQSALDRAGENRGQIARALLDTPAEQQAGMQFLVVNMPDRDLQSLSAEFLLENVRVAYQAWNESPWKADVPVEVFFNNLLPYANINEGRDRWRKEFYEQFKPLVHDAKSPSEAAAILNQRIFPLLKVRYSTERRKADQSPQESIKTGLASCTGLSVLLIDACRAVGVPARFVGTPRWADNSGNHSWIEVWDKGWHFTGAAEPTGIELDKAWFVDRAASARRDDPRHAIYAVSFQRTPLKFPLVWDPKIQDVSAVNVTDFYTRRSEKLPEGFVAVLFRAVERPSGKRLAVILKITDGKGQVDFDGKTNDETFDTNDHVRVPLKKGQEYSAEVHDTEGTRTQKFTAQASDTPVTIEVRAAPQPASSTGKSTSEAAVEALSRHLLMPKGERPKLEAQPFAGIALTRDDAARVERLLWQDHVEQIRQSRTAEMKARELTDGDLKMPFYLEIFGEKPKSGRSLYISMHGGGGAPKQVNDQQWQNQKKLYRLEEGIYVAPRAPTDTWNLWHQEHIDRLFGRLIENLIVLEDVNPDRVYLMGYSAGGDGVYQLAPRMADRFAAAAMMAGHPNETSPLGLRNLPFTIHVGGLDSAYKRNQIAGEWEKNLDQLQKDDPDGYEHFVIIYPNKRHWLDRLDAAAIPWMSEHNRNPLPKRIVWKQDDVTH
jgi:ketosteroid isomerase-like protein